MDEPVVAAARRVTVVDDENAASGAPRLLLRRAASTVPAEAVTWRLCYGGLPVATGSLAPGQDVSFIDAASILPSMDSSGFTITARYEGGENCPVEATCVRSVRPPTRAEMTARARRPGVRNQREAPGLRRGFVAETRDIRPPVSAHPQAEPDGQRRVCVYRHYSVLLAFRRRRPQTAPAGAAIAAADAPGGPG